MSGVFGQFPLKMTWLQATIMSGANSQLASRIWKYPVSHSLVRNSQTAKPETLQLYQLCVFKTYIMP